MPKVINLPTAASMDDSDYLIMEESGGGTKKITRANTLNGIGDTVDGANSAALTIPTNTDVNLCQITVPAGTWVLTAQMRVSLPSANKFLVGSISNLSATEQPGGFGGFGQISNAIVGFHTINLTRIYTAAQSTNIYLVGWHNSGSDASALVNQCVLRAVRIR